jgi:CxxC motif-containing protein (DUF1111 family)
MRAFFALHGRIVSVAYALTLAACTSEEPLRPEVGEELAGGDTTVFDAGARAFTLSARNLAPEHESAFFVGNSFFNKNWVIAPSSTTARDGLGPTSTRARARAVTSRTDAAVRR